MREKINMQKYIYVGEYNQRPVDLLITMEELVGLGVTFYRWEYLNTIWYFECSEPIDKLPNIFKSLFNTLFCIS